MTSPQQLPADGQQAEELVAYLDGELDTQACQRVERRLVQDADFRRQLRDLQQSWDLLDHLPEADVDERFTQSTIALVAVKATEDAHTMSATGQRRRKLAAWGLAAGCAAVFLISFALVRWSAWRTQRRLLRDLPVIEHLDDYRYADDIDFLRRLQQDGLFAEGELEDGL
jgi:anti-sigma factor RsiW